MKLQEILERFPDHKPSGKGWKATCPAHDDRNPSLDIDEGDDGRALLTCRAGCRTEAVLAAAELTMADLFDRDGNGAIGKPAATTKPGFPSEEAGIAWWLRKPELKGATVTVHKYPDGYRVFRFDFPDGRKTIRPMHWTEHGLIIGDPSGKLPLYGRDEIGDAETVHVAEGETCVDALRSLGLVAVTSAHGSKSPRRTDWTPVARRKVVIHDDNDDPGRRYAQSVATIGQGLGCQVKIVHLPGLPEGGDIVDFVEAHDSRETDDLRAMIEAIAEETPWLPPPTTDPEDDPESEAPSEPKASPLRFTEGFFSEHFVGRHGRSVRFVGEMGWLVWDGMRWAPDKLGRVKKLVKGTILDALAALQGIEDKSVRAERFKQIQRFDNSRSVKGILTLAEPEPPIRIPVESLDAHPMLLNCRNGTYDLETLHFRNHSRDDLITKVADVEYVEGAGCPRWVTFLSEIFDRDADLIAFIQRMCGYGLTGRTTEQCLFLLYGTGANGKSVFLKVVQTILGGYAMQANPEAFMARRSEGPRNDVARLAGARFVASVETEEGRRMGESLVKQLTGGDRVTARFLFREHFEFTPEFKLLIAANHKPVIRGTDHAIWRRLRLIPFEVTIPEEAQNPRLAEELLKERSGILDWMLTGCRAWQEGGLQPPASVTDATASYQAEQDTVRAFVAECCKLDAKGGPATTKDLLRAYQDHTGDKWMKPRVLGNRLKELGYELGPRGTGGRQHWTGLELAIEADGRHGE